MATAMATLIETACSWTVSSGTTDPSGLCDWRTQPSLPMRRRVREASSGPCRRERASRRPIGVAAPGGAGYPGPCIRARPFKARWQRYPNVTGRPKTTPCGFAAFSAPGKNERMSDAGEFIDLALQREGSWSRADRAADPAGKGSRRPWPPVLRRLGGRHPRDRPRCRAALRGALARRDHGAQLRTVGGAGLMSGGWPRWCSCRPT